MKKRNQKHMNRVRKMVVGCALCAIIMTVSTYAWFIGMKTVNVSAFDVKIAAIDSLSLSLDGSVWADTVSINGDNYQLTGTDYAASNQNSWGGSGLVPMSSIGKIDNATNKLVMYEKGSITTTKGGYRLLASRVKNTTSEETRGYVAFDLFIKNLSGNAYYSDLDVKNEEAIYLTPDSKVTVGSAGVAGTGIENSVRVGFAQIGRVEAKTAGDAIRGISCAGGSGVTNICSARDAQIWEPNDTKHVQNAINWYNTSCKGRTGDDVTVAGSYSGTCAPVTNGSYSQTYAIAKEIIVGNNVDVYDGTAYNGYAKSETNGFLNAYDYFTDSEKNKTGIERPTFITLAPNSVTKVRIYIWIEGQDVDNYDFASLGKQINVAFGFTKERLLDDDIGYDKSGVTDKDGTVVELPSDVKREDHPTASN